MKRNVLKENKSGSPEALTALKFFQKQMPDLAIIAAGSYLGIMSNEESFPIGKVEFLEMNPLHFEEFLLAIGGMPEAVKTFLYYQDSDLLTAITAVRKIQNQHIP